MRPHAKYFQIESDDIHGTGGEGKSEEEGEETGRRGDNATGYLGQVHFPN